MLTDTYITGPRHQHESLSREWSTGKQTTSYQVKLTLQCLSCSQSAAATWQAGNHVVTEESACEVVIGLPPRRDAADETRYPYP
jgi:hypothetical protein